jgi:hypothetical protein
VVALLVGGGLPAFAAQTEAKLPGGVVTASDAAARLDASVPKSVFVVPKDPSQGQDPFFPTSARKPGSSSAVSKSSISAPIKYGDLFYKGFSNLGGHPLAIINTHSFAVGEEAEVTAGTTRVRVRCLAIAPDRVVVEIGGERRELRLRKEL